MSETGVVRVRFEPAGVDVEIPAGRTLLEAAVRAGVRVEAPCGGHGTCGRCKVVAQGAVSEPGPDERLLLPDHEAAAGIRLACLARAQGDVVVRTEQLTGADSVRIVERGEERQLVVQDPSERGVRCGAEEACLGAAVDIGTTTLAASLLDLRTGREVSTASALNPQVRFGHDVMTRVTSAMQSGIEPLRAGITEELQRLLLGMLAAADAEVGDLREVAIAGNTTMVHLLLGIDPSPLAAAPYTGAFLSPATMRAEEAGIPALSSATVYVLPGISAFVGADITAGLLATSLAERDRPTLLIDLGTNGEVVLRSRDDLLASSTAAGPALEGMTIENGMRAEPGAIERVGVKDGDITISTIGDAAPRGICGSGLLDAVAVLVEQGILDKTGRMRTGVQGPLGGRVEEVGRVRRFVLDRASGVSLTQGDVRQVQLAKGAIASGVELLLQEAGVATPDVAEVIVAGGFGLHVRPHALAVIGMIPPLWEDRVTFAGNSAMTGAKMALLDGAARDVAAALAPGIDTLQLAAHPEFQSRFVGAMGFPAAG